MKVNAWVFGVVGLFMALVAPAYWFITDAGETGADWTGTSALVMAALLALMVTGYLGVHVRSMDPTPDDRNDGEIADGAGELGFFPPYSWWPLWCSICLSVIVYSIAVTAWWLMIIGFVFGLVTLAGWVFEYYRGDYAH